MSLYHLELTFDTGCRLCHKCHTFIDNSISVRCCGESFNTKELWWFDYGPRCGLNPSSSSMDGQGDVECREFLSAIDRSIEFMDATLVGNTSCILVPRLWSVNKFKLDISAESCVSKHIKLSLR